MALKDDDAGSLRNSQCSDRCRNGRMRPNAGNRTGLDRARIQGKIPKQLMRFSESAYIDLN